MYHLVIPFLIFFLLAWLVHWQLGSFKVKTNIPGLNRTLPFPIGNLFWFSGLKTGRDLYRVVVRIFAACDRVVGFWLGPKYMVFVKDPALIEGLLTHRNCINKDEHFYGSFNAVTDGVFSRNGKRWSAIRRPMDKLINPKVMDCPNSVLARSTTNVCEIIEENCDKGTIEDFPLLVFRIMFDVVAACHLGINVEDVTNDFKMWHLQVSNAVDAIIQRILKFPYQIEFFFNRSDEAIKLKNSMDYMVPLLDYAIASREKEYKRTGISTEHPDFTPSYVTDICIQAGKAEGLPYDKMRFSVMDFIIAGTDTSTITISTMILFLAMHPEYQEKAYEEQLEIMGDSILPPNSEQISKMSYLTMVHSETLRHVAPPGIVRNASSDVTLDGFRFPKGSALYFGLHHEFNQPEYWDKPHDFYPDHFLPEKVAKRPRGAFIPFSLGARSCPGKQFALFENRYIMSMLLRRFKFTTELKFNELVFEYKIMVESLKGYPVQAIKRPRPCLVSQ